MDRRSTWGKRKVTKAAHGTQDWVPWDRAKRTVAVVADIKAAGAWVVVAAPSDTGSSLEQLTPASNGCLVLGSDKHGVSQEVLHLADAVVSLPMLGIAKSVDVLTTAAIVLHWLTGSVQATRCDQLRYPDPAIRP